MEKNSKSKKVTESADVMEEGFSDYSYKEQFSDNSYKKGFIENPILTYELKENFGKPNIKNPEKGTWEIVSLTHHFVEYVEGEERTIKITDESREAFKKAKSDDEVRIRKERRHKAKGYSETSLEKMMSKGWDIPSNNKATISCEERIDLENALKKLSKKHREIIYLRFFVDMTLDEIGELKEVGKSAACKMVKKALEILRENY